MWRQIRSEAQGEAVVLEVSPAEAQALVDQVTGHLQRWLLWQLTGGSRPACILPARCWLG